MAILTVFGKSTIEEYREEIKTLKMENTTLKIDNKELSILLKESSEEKDIEIVEEKNSDGSYKKTKRIKTKKDSKTNKVDKKESSESLQTEILEKSNVKKESKIITNPKKLNLSIGIDNSLDKSIHLDYNFKGPLTIGGWVDEKGTFGIKLGVSF